MASTQPWVSSDTEIWSFDYTDDFIWYPDATSGIDWEFIGSFEPCAFESGKINSGELLSTRVNDNNKFILNEMNNTPGMCYIFKHFHIPDITKDYFLHFRGTYGGNSAHDVKFKVYNYDSTGAYVTFHTLETSVYTQDYFIDIPSGEEYYFGNTLSIILEHEDPGNSGHLLRINYWKLHEGTAP